MVVMKKHKYNKVLIIFIIVMMIIKSKLQLVLIITIETDVRGGGGICVQQATNSPVIQLASNYVS
jgi:hypothetical protein